MNTHRKKILSTWMNHLDESKLRVLLWLFCASKTVAYQLALVPLSVGILNNYSV